MTDRVYPPHGHKKTADSPGGLSGSLCRFYCHWQRADWVYIIISHLSNKILALTRHLRNKSTWPAKTKPIKPSQRLNTKELCQKDILIIAPYNIQVSALQSRLPEKIRIGTVDKFQGQEAPVVIYSMTSSSVEDAPRGMGFLYSPNRLNVATSRARCVCILIAAMRLLEPDCRTPEQMRWANGLCRFRELATTITI